MQVLPYLFFDGRAEEAIEYYKKALGAELNMLMRFKDRPPEGNPESNEECARPPGSEDKVMHASFRVGDTMVMASDGRCTGQPSFEGFSLTLTPATVEEADRMFNALADSGQVRMPMAKTFFSPRFGMVADKFGISWMIFVAPAEQASQAA
jgi:PhnB protein